MSSEYEEFSRLFKALGDPSRLELIHLLLDRKESLSVSALGERVAISQSTVSQHLRVLRDAGIVRAERHGASIHYQIDRPRLEEIGYRFRVVFGDILFGGATRS